MSDIEDDLIDMVKANLPAMQVEAISNIISVNETQKATISKLEAELKNAGETIKDCYDKNAELESSLQKADIERSNALATIDEMARERAKNYHEVAEAKQLNMLFDHLLGDQRALRDGLIAANRFYTQTTQRSHVVQNGAVGDGNWQTDPVTGHYAEGHIDGGQRVDVVDEKTTRE